MKCAAGVGVHVAMTAQVSSLHVCLLCDFQSVESQTSLPPALRDLYESQERERRNLRQQHQQQTASHVHSSSHHSSSLA